MKRSSKSLEPRKAAICKPLHIRLEQMTAAALFLGAVGLMGCDSTDSGSSKDEDSEQDSGTKLPPPPPPPPLPDAGVDSDAGVFSCGEPPDTTGSFSRKALLEASATCATYQFCNFAASALALRNSIDAYARDSSAEKREAAQDAWKGAMESWSVAELFQFGPLAAKTQDAVHGAGIRNLIYAWPNVSRCRVEEQVATEAYKQDFSKVLINGRGLYAVEYGLFYEGKDTECAASSATGKAFPGFSAAELEKRKRNYALAASEDVLNQAWGLYNQFLPEEGNFTKTLRDASGYENEQQALNIVAWALVYIEKEIKDWKLGIPAGYTAVAPVNGPESPFAKVAIENIRANLRGFRALFQGCGENGEGLGFDDWLRSVDHADFADEIIAAYENAQKVADEAKPLDSMSADELDKLYQAVRTLANLLKTEFFGAGSPINLKLPASVEGDTD